MKILLETAKVNGKVLLQDVHRIYASPTAAKNALEYLVRNKVLKITEKNGVFEYVGQSKDSRQVQLC